MTNQPQQDLYGEILDMNSQLIAAIRSQINNIEIIRNGFASQVTRCEEIARALMQTSVELAATSGDVLLSEFGLDVSKAATQGGEQ